MPETTYALFKGIRSHRITNPDARQSSETGTLNACNLCHLDRTLGWTARWLAQWYGADRLAELDGDDIAASVRGLLAGDAATRVVTAWAMGSENARRASGDDWQAPLLAELLVDPYAAVRRVAARSLRSLPGYRDLEYDFIAAPEHQRRARETALRTWPGSHRRERALLLDRMDNDRSIAVAELLASRDDRPISIAE
jgi:hypothetical protein